MAHEPVISTSFLPIQINFADLDTYPTQQTYTPTELENLEITIPDLDGNIFLLIATLVRLGILVLDPAKYTKLRAIFKTDSNQITKDDLNNWTQILSEATFNFPAKLRLLGDTIWDRGEVNNAKKNDPYSRYGNDLLTLLMLEEMQKKIRNLPADKKSEIVIISSNHDWMFHKACSKGYAAKIKDEIEKLKTLQFPNLSSTNFPYCRCGDITINGEKKDAYTVQSLINQLRKMNSYISLIEENEHRKITDHEIYNKYFLPPGEAEIKSSENLPYRTVFPDEGFKILITNAENAAQELQKKLAANSLKHENGIAKSSTTNLNVLIDKKIISFDEIKTKFTDSHLKHQKLIDYTITSTGGIIFHTHAPIDFGVIKALAEEFKKHNSHIIYNDETVVDLAETIDKINETYQSKLKPEDTNQKIILDDTAIDDMRKFNAQFRKSKKPALTLQEDFITSMNLNPVEFVLHNRNYSYTKVPLQHPKYRYEMGNVHGHAATKYKSTEKNRINLDGGGHPGRHGTGDMLTACTKFIALTEDNKKEIKAKQTLSNTWREKLLKIWNNKVWHSEKTIFQLNSYNFFSTPYNSNENIQNITNLIKNTALLDISTLQKIYIESESFLKTCSSLNTSPEIKESMGDFKRIIEGSLFRDYHKKQAIVPANNQIDLNKLFADTMKALKVFFENMDLETENHTGLREMKEIFKKNINLDDDNFEIEKAIQTYLACQKKSQERLNNTFGNFSHFFRSECFNLGRTENTHKLYELLSQSLLTTDNTISVNTDNLTALNTHIGTITSNLPSPKPVIH